MTSWVKTRAEAETQQFTLPARYEDWGRFASLIDGYAIAEEMGLGKLTDWVWPQLHAFEQTGEWPVETVMELRLLVFFKGRQDHFYGEAEHETFKVVHSLLKAIAQRTGLPYDDPQAEARFAEEEARWQARYSDQPHTEPETDGAISQKPPKVFGLLAALCTVGVIVLNMLLGTGSNSILHTSGVIVLLLSVVFMFPSWVLLKKHGHMSESGNYMQPITVVDQGLYGIVRHPQYLGYMLLSGGFVLVTQHWLPVLFMIVAIASFYLQAAAEEQHCAAHMGAPYDHYMQRVPRFNVILGIVRTLSEKSR